MSLLISVLLTNLITLTYCNASYPPNFFLKGPTSQATIYGVDGSKILSVADAGSISSDGIKGATFSSHLSSQNLGGSISSKILSPDCNCSQSESGVVLQGPSMSATIIGPSGSDSTGSNVDTGGNRYKNYNVPDNQRHYSSSFIETKADDNAALPSVPSVHIQGPSTWGTNVGPSYSSHSNFGASNKGSQQPSGIIRKPCDSPSESCGDNSFSAVHPSGTSTNIQGSSVLSATTGSGDQKTVGAASISLQNGKGVNFHSSSSPSYIYGPTPNDLNSNNKESSATYSKPCGQVSKNCNENGSDLNSGTSVNIQDASASSSIKGPALLSPNLGYLPNNNSGYSNAGTTINVGAPSGTPSFESSSDYSGSFGNPNVNHNLPTSHGASSFTSGAYGDYTFGKGDDKPGESSINVESSSAVPLIHDSNKDIAHSGDKKTWGSYNNGYFSGTRTKIEGPFTSSFIGGSSPSTGSLVKPYGASSSLSNVPGSDAYNTGNGNVHKSSSTVLISSGDSDKYFGYSGKNGAPGSYNKEYFTGTAIHNEGPSVPSSISGSRYYSSSFGNLNANQHLPTNGASTPDTYIHATGSGKFQKSNINVQSSTGVPLIKDFNKDVGQRGINKTPGSYNNLPNANSHQGFSTFSSVTSPNGQESLTSSTVKEPTDYLGHSRGKSGYFTSSSYISPVYNKPSRTGTTNWFVSKTISNADNKAVIPESSISRQNNVDSVSKGHNFESSSMASPTYILPNGVPQLANEVRQNQGFSWVNQPSVFDFGRDGKNLKDLKYDCYVIRLPINSYSYLLSPGEHSELLKKIARSAIVESDEQQQYHYHHND